MTLKLKPKMVLLGGKILSVSNDLADRIGRDARDMIGEDITKFVPANFTHFAENSLRKEGKIVLLDKNGKPYELDVVFDGEKTLLVDFGELRDVIREAYSAVWDFHYGFIFVDEDGGIITCSDTFYRFMNLKAEEVEGKKVWDVFGDWTRDVVNRALSGTESMDVEVVFRGRVLRGRLKFRVFDVYGRKIIEVLTRTVEEERIRNLEKTFGSLNYPVVVAEEDRVVYQNRKAMEIFGDKRGRGWEVLDCRDVQHFKLETAEGLRDFIVFKMEAKEKIFLFFDFSEYIKVMEEMERELVIYKEMVEKSIDMILLIDNQANILFVNEAVKAYGYKPEEVVGRKFTEFLPRDEAKAILREYENFVRTGDFRRREVRIYTKDKELRWVDVLGRGVRDKDGNIAYAVAIVRDVTERKKMMDELWRSRELYRSFFELSPDFVGVVDVSGRLQYANKQFLDEIGRSIDEIKNLNILNIVYAEDRERAIRLFRKALKSRETVRGIFRADVNGKIKTFDVAVKFIYDEEKPLYALIVSRDISRKIELERRLRERENLYRTLTENSLAAIFVIQDDRIVYCNRVFEMMTGYSREEWEKMDAYVCFEGEIADKAREAIREVMEGKIVETTARYVTKSGEIRYADFIMAPIEYKGKRAVIGNAVDITEKRKAERRSIEREELYRTLTEKSHTGIFIITEDEEIVYANPKLFEIFGYSEEEIQKLGSPYDVIAPEFREMVMERLRRRLRGEELSDSYEIKVMTKRGERWMKVLASNIRYKRKPAVLVNLADVTDLKLGEEKLRKLNLFLTVVNEINRAVFYEKSSIELLKKVREILEKLDADVMILINTNGRLKIIEASGTLRENDEIIRSAEKHCFTCEKISILQISRGNEWVVIVPLMVDNKNYGAIVLVTKEQFDRDAVEIMETLARDIAFALRAIEIERDREVAINVILRNLEQFEELADKLRNPLAIIKGYIEVREEFEYEELLEKIWKQAERIEKILDELRERELVTYRMKKLFEGS